MAADSLYWLNMDIREYLALTRHILFKCCKKAKEKYKLGQDIEGWERSIETEYKPIDFLDFKWIVDRCNFKSSKDYGADFLPNSFISWYDEAHFVPEYFDADFVCDYKKMKNGKWKKIQADNEERDFISGAQISIANKVIVRWKLYGSLCVKLSNLLWKIRRKLLKK